MSKWYSITAKADGETVDVHIYDEIGFWGTTARSFVNELKSVADNATQINLHINSPGGSVVDGVAIQNALKQHPANVTTKIDGIAASIASIIALAGDSIEIADNAYVMIHNPASIVWGDAEDMLKEAEVLNKMADGIASDYAAKMGISVEDARALMDEETWYLGQEAVDAGFADKTYTGSKAAASFSADRFTAKAPAEALKRFTKSPSGGNSNPSAHLTTKGSDPMPDETTTTEQESASVETEETVETPVEETAVDDTPDTDTVVNEAVQKALANERVRTSEITALGSKFGFAKDAEDHIASGKSVEQFRAHILNKSPDDWKASLEVRNPAQQSSEDDDEEDSGSEAVARIKERRKARFNS